MLTHPLFLMASGAAMVGLFFTTDAQAKKRPDFKITAGHVKQVCGGSLQGDGSAFGCSKCGKKNCTDYSCNYTGKHGRQGCWRTSLQKTATGGKGRVGKSGVSTPVTSAGSGPTGGWKGKDVSGSTGVDNPLTQGPTGGWKRGGGSKGGWQGGGGSKK